MEAPREICLSDAATSPIALESKRVPGEATKFQTPPAVSLAVSPPDSRAGIEKATARKRSRLDPRAEAVLFCTDFRAKLAKLLSSQSAPSVDAHNGRAGSVLSNQEQERQQSALSGLKSEVHAATETQLELRHELARTREDNAELLETVSSLQKKLQHLENELDSIKLDSAHARHDLEVEKETAKGYLRLIEKHEASRVQRSEQEDALKHALRILKTNTDRISEGDVKLCEYFDTWKRERAEIRQEIDAVSAQNRQLQWYNDAMQSATCAATEQMRGLRKQVEMLNERVVRLSDENAHLHEKNLRMLDTLQEHMSDKVAQLFVAEVSDAC
eukprot:scaffold1866_cov277-Pinguiococcus_pyrenoidosus.AAC.5